MFRSVVIALSALLGASAAYAGTLPPIAFLSMGFREAHVADFTPTPQIARRRAAKNGLLSVTADFNGDGQADEGRILLNEERAIACVVVVIRSETAVDTYVLAQTSLSEAADLGIVTAEPLASSRHAGRRGISIISASTGNGHANYFDGESFEVGEAVAVSLNAN